MQTQRATAEHAEPCHWCEEPIREGERVAILPCIGRGPVVYHAECLGRVVLGPAAHQLRKCPCFGGTETEDPPPGMSKREAAREAVQVAAVLARTTPVVPWGQA